jgi:hypothetical protein
MQRQSWAFLGKKKNINRAEISWRRVETTDLIACCNFFSGVCVEGDLQKKNYESLKFSIEQ